MIKWIKAIFSMPTQIKYYEIEDREYTIGELLCILRRETLTLATGNAIVLTILRRFEDRISKLERSEGEK